MGRPGLARDRMVVDAIVPSLVHNPYKPHMDFTGPSLSYRRASQAWCGVQFVHKDLKRFAAKVSDCSQTIFVASDSPEVVARSGTTHDQFDTWTRHGCAAMIDRHGVVT